MQSTVIPVDHIPPLEHEEAMRLAQAEYQHLIELVDQLAPEDWDRPTDRTDWDVTALLAHLLGMMKLDADPAALARQFSAANRRAASTGEMRIDALRTAATEALAAAVVRRPRNEPWCSTPGRPTTRSGPVDTSSM